MCRSHRPISRFTGDSQTELRAKEGITCDTWAEHQRQKNKKRPAEVVADDEEDLDLLSDSEDDV